MWSLRDWRCVREGDHLRLLQGPQQISYVLTPSEQQTAKMAESWRDAITALLEYEDAEISQTERH